MKNGTSKSYSCRLTLLTLNDVYEIEPDPRGVGGFAPLGTLLAKERERAKRRGSIPLSFICGDFLSASRLGEAYKGAHMIDFLNRLGFDYAVFGNHEFDFGNQVCRQRIKESKFTWLGSNVLELDGSAFGGSKFIEVLEFGPSSNKTKERRQHHSHENGDVQQENTEKAKEKQPEQPPVIFRVGLIGLCTLATPSLSFPDEDVVFAPVLQSAERAIQLLRQDPLKPVHLVIAVTHLSSAQDKELARKMPDIDVIIGGHDHSPMTFFEGKTLIYKCGQNAEYLGRIDVSLSIELNQSDDEGDTIERVSKYFDWKMMLNKDIQPDNNMEQLILSYTSKYDESMKEDIGIVGETGLDSTLTRVQENTMANFLVDALYELYADQAEVAIINGGFIRGNRCYEPGYRLTIGDVNREFPFPKRCVLLELKVKDFVEALEQGLREAENPSGFFPHLSKGWRYTFSTHVEAGRRLVSLSREVDGRQVLYYCRDPKSSVGGENGDQNVSSDWGEKDIKILVTEYMRGGGDGYLAFKRGRHLVCPGRDSTIINQHVIDYLRKRKHVPVVAHLEGRSSRVDEERLNN
ncbi:Bifunctional metallophosphatase/5'-nucleotidase [Balamuthia mandrillaris]